MSTITKDLGAVTAYAYAKEKGYTGTEAEFAELMASYATVAQQAGESAQTASEKAQQASASATSASQSASSASASAQTAQTAQQTATAKASEAQQSATTATTKAQEASQSASESSQSASTAVQAKQDAQTAKTASETAQASAESARDDAETARDEAQQYAESIDPQKLIGAYPVDTASGSIASFTDGADNIPMKSVKVRIEPVQDLHGQDAPYPAGGGKNLLETTATSKTENGITFTVNPDGSVLVNGTATEQANFLVNPDGKLIPAGTQITVSGCPANGSMDTYSFWATTQTYLEHGNGITFTPSEDIPIIGRIRIAKGCVCNNLLFKPQIEKGSAKTSWSPYSNICPISGWTGVNVSHSGADTTNPTVYPISWQSEAGTVYGGTLDVTSGELVVTHASKTFDGTENWFEYNAYEGYSCGIEEMKKGFRQDGKSNMLVNSKISATAQKNAMWLGVNSRIFYVIGVHESMGSTLDTFKAFLAGHNLIVTYPLEFPITLTLTPIEIKSLLGSNNVWADTGDSTVTYRADTTLYINRKIAEAVSALS